MVSSNPFAGLPPRTTIFSFLLSVCNNKLLSPPKKATFLPSSLLNENCERASNLIPKPLYPYLSRSALLVHFTCPKSQFHGVNFVFKSLETRYLIHRNKRIPPISTLLLNYKSIPVLKQDYYLL